VASDPAGERAFIDACVEHFAPICRYVRTSVGTIEEAEDLTQEVLLQAFESRSSFTGGNLKAWLYQIARNRIAKSHRRKSIERRGREALRARYTGTSATQGNEFSEMQESLVTALEELSALEQEVVRLKFARFDNDEIVRMLNISRNHLNVVFFRAVQKLRSTLEKNDSDPKEMSVPR
jgi:RNA polymerase sigma-70 factor (ECF subfamily)